MPNMFEIACNASQTVTTNITTTMDALLVLLSLSFYFTGVASYVQRRRIVNRQQASSSSPSSPSSSMGPTQTSSPSTTPSTSDHSLPASIQTRIPTHPSATPSGEVQTAIPVHPDPGPDKGPIIGFSIGIVVLVLLVVATGWLLFLRYKRRRQRQATPRSVVQLQPTNRPASSTIKKSFDDTQSAASQL